MDILDVKRYTPNMTKHYLDYFWKDGAPTGRGTAPASLQGTTYKIVSDPYHKRISIEKYVDRAFERLIYDSAIFDFRHLQPALQTTWQKTPVSETAQKVICQIRNQDDRLILIEEYLFENHLCRECKASSPFGIQISRQKIFYESLKDPFNGVILYDSNDHPVISKRYQMDEATQEFSKLLEEKWDMS